MTHLIVSLSATLGSEVYVGKSVIAVVYDIVCNKDTGKITYFVLCPQTGEEGEAVPEYFAIHHSYFYFDGADQVLTYSPKLGNDDYGYFVDLPPQYDLAEVKDLTEFNRYVSAQSNVAGHRSDND